MERPLSASMEDYLEAIAVSAGFHGEVQPGEIADAMEVSRPSVTSALRALARRGLVNYSPYSRVSLTEQGREKAGLVMRRHEVLRRFFAGVLGADQVMADRAACRVEHAIGEEITERLVKFLDHIENCPAAGITGFRFIPDEKGRR